MTASARQVRPAAQAGRFYPGTPAGIRRDVERYLGGPLEQTPGPYRAVMLPHAGWLYCGAVMGATLRGLELPSRAIVVGPRHTPYGARWSVAPEALWELPGDRVPIDAGLRSALIGAVDGLVAEPEAHAQEHGVEVILPFLRRLRPDLAALPIVLGRASWDELGAFAEGLAAVVAACDERPLLVISSDMHHFGSEAENRRLDGLALDALATGDPRALLDVVTAHDITMCGVLPAVLIMRALLRLDDAPLVVERVAYDTSGTASGDTARVVGYAGVRIA